MLFNTEKEQEIKLGRDYKFDPLGFGECNVHQDILDDLDLEVGDIIYMTFSVSRMMEVLMSNYNKFARENNWQ